MRTFFLHLKTSDGAVDRDDIGLACENIEQAYLRVCEAIPDVAAEIIRSRRDPMKYSFLIENDAGELLMTVPFTELVREKLAYPKKEGDLDMARRHVRQGTERLRRQGEIVERLRARGSNTKESEGLYKAFEQVLRQHHRFLDRILAERDSGIARAARKSRSPLPR